MPKNSPATFFESKHCGFMRGESLGIFGKQVSYTIISGYFWARFKWFRKEFRYMPKILVLGSGTQVTENKTGENWKQNEVGGFEGLQCSPLVLFRYTTV